MKFLCFSYCPQSSHIFMSTNDKLVQQMFHEDRCLASDPKVVTIINNLQQIANCMLVSQ